MMRSVLNILVLLTATSAFAPTRQAVSLSSPTARHMYSAEGPKKVTAKPLEEVSPLEEASASDSVLPGEPMQSDNKTFVKDMNTGEIREVNWVDPAMPANSDPFNLGWAWAFVVFPALLLLNDFFHFLPSGTFLTKY
eukprot:scaffold6485_cov172-Amphora_coffeaeformis.AAC.10